MLFCRQFFPHYLLLYIGVFTRERCCIALRVQAGQRYLLWSCADRLYLAVFKVMGAEHNLQTIIVSGTLQSPLDQR